MQGNSLKTSDASHTDRFKYGHDRNSSRLYRDNILNDTFDELYHTNGASAGYDQLNQLTDFRRGALSDTNSDNVPDTVTSPLRQQGWDFDALSNFDTQTTDGTPQSRTHNKQNQSTVVDGNNLTFDANGNTTKDETGKTYTFDAFNRLVLAKDSGGSTIATYSFDALGRRIVETVSGTTRDIFFSPGWQVVEEQISGTAKTQYVWSPVYIDALIARDRDADGNGTLEERLYAQQDANFNVTSVINTSGSVVERYIYDPYGTPTFLNASWTSIGTSAYSWTTLHQGGRFEPVTGLYLFRHRDYSPTLGRWLEVDPIGILTTGSNLYRFLNNAPHISTDPQGLYPSRRGNTWGSQFDPDAMLNPDPRPFGMAIDPGILLHLGPGNVDGQAVIPNEVFDANGVMNLLGGIQQVQGPGIVPPMGNIPPADEIPSAPPLHAGLTNFLLGLGGLWGFMAGCEYLTGQRPSVIGMNLGFSAGFAGGVGGFSLGGFGVQILYHPGTEEIIIAPYLNPPSIAFGLPGLNALTPRGFLEALNSNSGGFGGFAAFDIGPVVGFNVDRPGDLSGWFFGGELSALFPTPPYGLGVGGHIGYLTWGAVQMYYGGLSVGLPGLGAVPQGSYTLGPWSFNAGSIWDVIMAGFIRGLPMHGPIMFN